MVDGLEDVEVAREQAQRADEDVAPEGNSTACAMKFGDISGLELLTRVSRAQRENHLTGKATGSVTASDRLMKELREIYRSEHYKNGKPSSESSVHLSICVQAFSLSTSKRTTSTSGT